MDYYTLRQKIRDYPKFSSVKHYKNYPIVNEAYPGQFNLSFTETIWLKEFGNYLDFDKDLIFSLIQPVIRYNDFKNHILPNQQAHKYLALFEMADLVGIGNFIKNTNREAFTRFEVQEFVKFFIKLGFSQNDIYISCFGGGKVNEITKGKYTFDKLIPPFEFGIKEWRAAGIPRKNIINDRTRDTLLALNVFGRPSPWGYRNEIYLKHKNGELIDVGTLEYLIWRPIFKNGEIVGIEDYEHFYGINLLGIERLCMIMNGYEHIALCDHIRPLIEIVTNIKDKKNFHSCFVACECLRAIHRIISDVKDAGKLSRNRRTKFNDYLEALYIHLDKLGIQNKEKIIENLLKKNSDLNPFYPELKINIKNSLDTVLTYFKRRF
jgi:hypothetical protein